MGKHSKSIMWFRLREFGHEKCFHRSFVQLVWMEFFCKWSSLVHLNSVWRQANSSCLHKKSTTTSKLGFLKLIRLHLLPLIMTMWGTKQKQTIARKAIINITIFLGKPKQGELDIGLDSNMGNNGMSLHKSLAIPDLSCGIWLYTSKGYCGIEEHLRKRIMINGPHVIQTSNEEINLLL